MSRLLVLGATSDIAIAAAREFAQHGLDIYLAGRNMEVISAYASDISIRFYLQACPPICVHKRTCMSC